MVGFLLRLGADPNAVDPELRVPVVLLAEQHGDVKSVEMLLERGARFCGDGGTSAAMLADAAASDDPAMLRMLLRHAPHCIDDLDDGGDTALITAVKRRRAQNVKLLIDAGASPNVADGSGRRR